MEKSISDLFTSDFSFSSLSHVLSRFSFVLTFSYHVIKRETTDDRAKQSVPRGDPKSLPSLTSGK